MALKNFNQSISCGAQSMINNESVLYLNATIPSEGSISINKSIQNRDLYFSNQEECDTDYEAFNNKVEEIAKEL